MSTEYNVNSKKITDWSNEPSVLDLRNDLVAAKTVHDNQVSLISEWLDNLHIEGAAKPKAREGRSKIQPMLIRKQAEWRYAALSEPFMSTQDLFDVNPVTYEDVKAAKQNALVLNSQFSTKINKVKFIDDFVRAAVNEGTAIVRTGWKYRSEDVEVDKPIFEWKPASTEEEMVAIKTLMDSRAKDPNTFDNNAPDEVLEAIRLTEESGTPYIPIYTGSEKVTETKVLTNHPTVDVCDYRNVIVDPSCNGDINNAEFIIYAFETSLSELREEGDRYTNLEMIQVDSVEPISSSDYHNYYSTSGFQFQDEPRKRLVAYEYWGYWDIDDSGVTKPIVATFVGETMIRMEENQYPDGKPPFVLVPYLPVTGSVYGEPDGALLKDNQKIIGAVTRGMIDVMGRSAAGQKGIAKGLLDNINRRKYAGGQDFEFNPSQGDPRSMIIDFNYPELPQSTQLMLMQQNQEAEAMTGVRAFAGTNSGTALAESATAVRTAIDAASKREAAILKRISKGIVDIGRKFIAMNAEWLSDEEVIRITNDEFIPIKRDDLQGNFDLQLTISTAEEDEAKAGRMEFLLQTMGNTVPWEVTQIMLEEVLTLRKLPHAARKIAEYVPQPDPVAQQTAQLEMQKLQMEVQKLQAEIGKITADTRNKDSDTDLKNLEYVEEERGVNHERDKEKIATQAQTNLAVELIKGSMQNAQPQTTSPTK